MDYKQVTHCRICGSDQFTSYLKLGDHPLCNSLLNSPDEETPKYPVELLLCKGCHLSQLSVVVNPEILYSRYLYHSSVSQTFKDHCYKLGETLKSMWIPASKPEWFHGDQGEWDKKVFPTVLDIASNDGCLLKEFRKLGFGILGVEPAQNLNNVFFDNLMTSSSEENLDNLIPTIKGYWSTQLVNSVDWNKVRPWTDATRSIGLRSFVTATNVLGHVDDIGDFIEGVKLILEPNGVFVAEVPYVYEMVEGNQFDTVYHEHLSYFLLGPLTKLFKDRGIPIFRVEQLPIHGGSLRVYAATDGRPIEDNVGDLINIEFAQGMYTLNPYFRFQVRVNKIKLRFAAILEVLKSSQKKVIGYGASAKGISLLNYCQVPKELIHSIVDDTPDKQFKFTPGTKIFITSSEKFKESSPDYIILLAWNFAKELMVKTEWHKDKGGQYIIPIPEFRFV